MQNELYELVQKSLRVYTLAVTTVPCLHAADVSHACYALRQKLMKVHACTCSYGVKSISLQLHGAAHVRELYLWM